ncbi:MAG: hypothetical protein WCF16_12630, partial [Alphaproteobacteria bacterium]
MGLASRAAAFGGMGLWLMSLSGCAPGEFIPLYPHQPPEKIAQPGYPAAGSEAGPAAAPPAASQPAWP